MTSIRHSHMKQIIVPCFLLFFVVTSFIFIGCEEINIPILSDDEEIIRYLETSSDALGLFRTENLILPVPVYLLEDSAIYIIEHVDSVKRSYEIRNAVKIYGGTAVRPVLDYGSVGLIQDAEATVMDNLYITRNTINGIDTTSSTYVRSLKRYAYFRKLGDDSQRYHGWLLRGYNGGRATNGMTIKHQNGSSFEMDSTHYHVMKAYLVDIGVSPVDTIIDSTVKTIHAYVDLNKGDFQIERVDPNELITFSTPFNPSDTVPSAFSISGKIVSGYTQRQLSLDNNELKTSILVPSSSLMSWNIFFIQNHYYNVNDSTKNNWCIPFYVE